jgi:hypothetical protein
VLHWAAAVGQRSAQASFRRTVAGVDGRVSSSLAARLEVGAAAAAPGGSVGYAVINAGDVPIILGDGFGLERLSDGRWERVELPYAFRLWGPRLESGDRYELSARVADFVQPGRYRLRKRLDADRDPHPEYEWVAGSEIQPIELTAEFNVAVD